MIFSFDLLINAIVSGILLGGFYAAVTAGVSLSFGILDIVNIAHPAFIILGSYIAYIVNAKFGIDPIISSIIADAGLLCARRGDLSGLLRLVREARTGIAARTRVLLRPFVHHRSRRSSSYFGVDYRYVEASYIGPTLHLGFLDLPLRMLVPCLVSLLLIAVPAARA